MSDTSITVIYQPMTLTVTVHVFKRGTLYHSS
jgi:hypothetical protein